MEIISQKDAKKQKLTQYFTGKPCKNGHTGPRQTSNSACIECQRENYHTNKEKYQQRYTKNRERLIQKQKERDSRRKVEIQEYQRRYRERTVDTRLTYHKEYYHINSDELKKRSREYYKKNKQYYQEYNKTYYEENKAHILDYADDYRKNNRREILSKKKDYYTKNKNEFIARNAKRRSQKNNATPLWFESEKVKSLYEEAARLTIETGKLHHVDHIIPLRGKIVCGLHCFDNLQILLAEENLIKSNKFSGS